MISFVLDTAGLSSSSAFTTAPAQVILFVVLAGAWVFALGVAALVVLEAVVPTGTLPNMLGFFAGWGARRRRAKRYSQIVVISVKHGLGRYFAASLEEELDYTVERDNMRAVTAGHAGGQNHAIAVPHVYEDYTSSTVLVMDKLPGVPIAHAQDLLAAWSAADRNEAAERLLNEVFRQILVTGVFHADLHPGNILITEDRCLGMLDFGSVGRLDEAARTALATLFLAIDRDDAIAATNALIELLDRPEGLAERELERAIGQLVLRYRTGFGNSGSAGMFAILFRVISVHRFAIPPQIAAAFRALGALEGTLRILSPDIDIVATARAQGREIMGRAVEPGNLRQGLERQLLGLLPILQRLPRRINRITEDGELSAQVGCG